jgi:hypothetical protein
MSVDQQTHVSFFFFWSVILCLRTHLHNRSSFSKADIPLYSHGEMDVGPYVALRDPHWSNNQRPEVSTTRFTMWMQRRVTLIDRSQNGQGEPIWLLDV